ncbi:Ni,Fe-hydrogenase I large subunit [Halorhabdus sp. SVX81]|uniref:nickel-dependent hydrogenase large subunit n=1 Tax=Halorhabdus sp. SVX81 TaxID=2978283 RepID=UPI0023DBA90B|nr:nickel-dependent hydrogenase large subunit [Halorhabdus sp. SVX81]WEL17153.1 Ni,Fe-hydrogenase I large subunit [Halorhabdus sp. SVX81]
MPEITINPTTRIEGHHATTLDVEDGVVQDAKSHMEMFRGIESVTLERPPSAVPDITGKVCGVCFTCHRLTSSRAVEDAAMAAGVFDGVPRNAHLLRDAMEGIFYLWNHTIHLYALAGPDYSDAVAGTGLTRLDPMEGEGYLEAMDHQRTLMQAFAEFGGRVPNSLTYVPGGMSANPDASTIQSVKDHVASVSEWIGPTDAVPEVIENVRNGEFEPSVGAGLHDLVGLLYAAAEEGAAEYGVGPRRYYSNGVFRLPEREEFLFKRGIYRDGSIEPQTKAEILDAITESTAHSWYTDDSAGHPASAKPPEPAPGKDGAYSWGKAPRYEGQPMEVGPLARLVISDIDPFDLRAELGGASAASNTLNRLIARTQEILLVRDNVLGLLDAIEPGDPFTAEWDDDFDGQGVSLFEASRGALSHWADVRNGQINQYQIVTPTLWNMGPRDSDDTPGPLESALVGMEVEDVETPLDVMRTIRSMDPCLACSVHLQTPTGEYETVLEPATPGAVGKETTNTSEDTDVMDKSAKSDATNESGGKITDDR